MNTGYRITLFAGIAALGLGLAVAATANDDSAHSQRKAAAKKTQPLPPLPSGPTGPVPQIPLDTMTPVPPQVSYQNGQLTIIAPNSTLGDILRAVRKQTGAEIEIPTANDRVVTRLGPGPAQEVMADLLNGSRFNYVLLGSPTNAGLLTRVVLVAKSGGAAEAAAATVSPSTPPQAAMNQVANVNPQEATDTADADAPDESADDNSDQAAEAEQPAAAPTDQPEVKTPQQMLQEMQQRQLQLQQQQQQQQPGQPPTPGAPGTLVPQRPPQEQQ